MKKFFNKPMTWGGYFKFAGVMSLISILIMAVSYAALFWGQIEEWFVKTFCKTTWNAFTLMKEVLEEQG